MDRITDYLVKYAASLEYEQLPAEVVGKTKGVILDTLGCAMGGYSSEPAKIARRFAERVTSSDLPATIIGSGRKSSPELAAFANGTMIRYLDLNDSFPSIHGGHPSDNLAALLTCADALHADGKRLIVATVLTYEVMYRLGNGINSIFKGFDHCLPGVIACSIGVTKLLGLPREQSAQAINLGLAPNLALNQTRAGEISLWKGCAGGNAARNAVFAALLARDGMTGPTPVFEGRFGLFNAIGGRFELEKFGGGNTPFAIMGTSIKSYPCGKLAQTAVDAAVKLRSMVSLDDIAEISVETFEHAKGTMAGDPEKWHPRTRETADHSIPYVVSVALMHGPIQQRHFNDEFRHDPALAALMQKVKVTVREDYNRMLPDASPARVELVTKSGERLTEEVLYWHGYYRNPFTDREIEQKFHSLASDLVSSRQRADLVSLIWGLENVEDVNRIMCLVTI
ncbi:MAG: MmgE/PrpD family protein [Chloroflexi bacterium]|nr:MmgE/PrpD family protein [Chloroflexota bacterium]